MTALLQLKTQQVFRQPRSGNQSTLKPLDAASKWASEHTLQGNSDRQVATPMVLFNEEMSTGGKTWRQIVAIEVTTLMEIAHNRTSPMFYHEIIATDAPAKLAFDLECKFDSPAAMQKAEEAFGTLDVEAIKQGCERLTSILIEEALDRLQSWTGRSLVTAQHVVILDCSRSDKWSKHVTIDGSDDENESIVFGSDRDCLEFVRTLLARPVFEPYTKVCSLIVDLGVYSTRHPLRTYYSAKRGKEHLWLRHSAGNAPCVSSILARSMRSVFITHSASGDFYRQSTNSKLVTSLYLFDNISCLQNPMIRFTVRFPMGTTVRGQAAVGTSNPLVEQHASSNARQAGDLIAAILSDPGFEKYKPKSARFRDCNSILVICDGLVCADHDTGEHRENHKCVYLIVDLLRRRFVQLCHSFNCNDRRSITPARNRLLPSSLDEHISDYLCGPDWSLGEKVGVDFAAAIGMPIVE